LILFFSCKQEDENDSVVNESAVDNDKYVTSSEHITEFDRTVTEEVRRGTNSTYIQWNVYTCQKCGFEYSPDDYEEMVETAYKSVGYSPAEIANIKGYYRNKTEFKNYYNLKHVSMYSHCQIPTYIYEKPGYTKFHEMRFIKKTYQIYTGKETVAINYKIAKCKFCNLSYTWWDKSSFVSSMNTALITKLGYSYEEANKISLREVEKEPIATYIKNYSEYNQPSCIEHFRITNQ
jgi:hypothetical protein